jgi:hypothetical protein
MYALKILQILIFQVAVVAAWAQSEVAPQQQATSAETPSNNGSPTTTEMVMVQQGIAAAPKPLVLSFMEWKSLRVHEAQQKLEQIAKGQDGAPVWHEGKSVSDDKEAEQRLNFNVDVALQLNIQDYFSMYLKNLSKEEFKEATKKLNPEEVTELLIAYKNSQEKTKGPILKFTKSPKDNARGKNPEI